MTDVVTLGEALVAYRSHGRLGFADRISASAAGAEMNVAIGLARLGHEDELDLVSGADSESARIDDLLGAAPREVIVKRGRQGAEVFSPEGSVACPAFAVAEVNSIGAGDAFTAGYLSGMLDDLPTEARLRRAAACGAFAVAGDGDWEQAPTRSDLDRFLGAADTAR